MRYVFIVNPKAGVKNIYEDICKIIESNLNDTDAVYQIFQSDFKGDITEIARRECEKGDKLRIYAFGGDGTLHETVKGVAGFDNVEIGIFPSGSGNDFIKSFGQRKDFLNFKNQINGKSIKVDLIESTSGVAINNICLGFDAKIGSQMTMFKNLPLVSGSRAYELSLVKSLLAPIGDDMRIKIATKEGVEIHQGKYLFVVASSGQYYGGGFKAAPEAIVDDGLLDFVLIKKPPLVKIPALVDIYKKGEHLNSPKFKKYLTYCQGYKLSVSSEKNVYCSLDGEGVKLKEEKIGLSSYKINFILPDGIEYKKIK